MMITVVTAFWVWLVMNEGLTLCHSSYRGSLSVLSMLHVNTCRARESEALSKADRVVLRLSHYSMCSHGKSVALPHRLH